MSQILVIYSNSWIRSMGKHTILHHNFQTKNSINNIACSLSLFEASRTKLPYLNTNKHKTHLGTWNRIFFDMQLLPFSELSSENTLQIRLNEDTRGSKIVRNSFWPPHVPPYPSWTQSFFSSPIKHTNQSSLPSPSHPVSLSFSFVSGRKLFILNCSHLTKHTKIIYCACCRTILYYVICCRECILHI